MRELHRVTERIYEELEHLGADGIRWHRQLLDQMNTATERRAMVIDQQVYDMLLEYLSFRHMVRHTYPGMLDWDRFRDIARDLLNAHARVDQSVRRFVTAATTDDK